MGTSTLEDEAQRLRAGARNHMRAARRHRRRAQELMAQLDHVVAQAAQRGIQININARQDHSGGPSGNADTGTPG